MCAYQARSSFSNPLEVYPVVLAVVLVPLDDLAKRTAEAVNKHPEFKGNVVSVESYEVYSLDAMKVYKSGWAKHFAEWCVVGSERPYHYLGSGKFFVRFGDSLATSMAKLMQQR